MLLQTRQEKETGLSFAYEWTFYTYSTAASERLKTSRRAPTSVEMQTCHFFYYYYYFIFLRDPLSRFTGQLAESQEERDYAEERKKKTQDDISVKHAAPYLSYMEY